MAVLIYDGQPYFRGSLTRQSDLCLCGYTCTMHNTTQEYDSRAFSAETDDLFRIVY